MYVDKVWVVLLFEDYGTKVSIVAVTLTKNGADSFVSARPLEFPSTDWYTIDEMELTHA